MIVCHKQCTLLWVGVIKNVSIILFGNSKQLYYNRFPYIAVFFNRLQSKKVFPKCIFITPHFRSQHSLYVVECETTGQKMAKQKTSKYILQSNSLLDLRHNSLQAIFCAIYFRRSKSILVGKHLRKTWLEYGQTV